MWFRTSCWKIDRWVISFECSVILVEFVYTRQIIVSLHSSGILCWAGGWSATTLAFDRSFTAHAFLGENPHYRSKRSGYLPAIDPPVFFKLYHSGSAVRYLVQENSYS